MTWLHNCWQWCRGCQQRYLTLSSGLPKEGLHWAHLDFIVKEARKGPASWFHNSNRGASECILQGPEATGGNKRCHEAVLLLKWVPTFKTTEKIPDSGSLPALAPLGSMLWRESHCFPPPLPVKHLYRRPRDALLLRKDLAPHHYRWSTFFHKKCPLFLWNSAPQLCHRLGKKKSQEKHKLLIEQIRTLRLV